MEKFAKKQLLASGIPPWHAALFVGSLFGVSVVSFPSVQSIDELATVETFSARVFPELISLRALMVIRSLVAVPIWGVTIKMIFWDEGWTMYTNYRPTSKLINKFILLRGALTLCPFTSWCWILLGFSFSLNAYIAGMVDIGRGETIAPWVLRSALILWETAAPFALLVSAVVRYAIWPVVLAGGRPHTLGNFRNQMMHNINTVYALVEMAMLGGLPIAYAHMAIPCLVGVIYIAFAWTMAFFAYGTPEEGPQYTYWFMDTTLGKTTTIALLALLTVLVSSFAVFAGLEHLIEWIGGGFWVHIVFVVGVSSLVVRST